jgi:tetratricopeptide (TPR) repeat protein
LAVLYIYSSSLPLWQSIGSLLLLLIVSGITIRLRHRQPYLAVGWFWFLVTLVPVIGLIHVGSQSMADRYTYIPLIGLFIMAAWGVPDLTKGVRHRAGILALLAGAVIIASAALTWQQLGYWRDSFSLFRHTLQVTTDNYIIHNNLGSALENKGEVDSAIQEYQIALLISPNYAIVHYNLGIALAKKGDQDSAINEFQKAVTIKPNLFNAHDSLGAALGRKGDLDAAIKEFQEVLRLSPNNVLAHNNLGAAFANKGDLDAAIQEYQEALRINPSYTMAKNNLENTIAQKRMKNEARK